MPDSDGVVVAEDEAVLFGHVPGDAELGLHVVLHVVTVAVQVVRGDIEDDGYVGLEVIHAVKLETAEFQYIDVKVFGRHLIGVALADVAGQPYVKACVAEHIVDERGGRGLAVAAGDADLPGAVIPAGELYLRYYRYAGLDGLADYRGRVRYPGTLYYLIGIENPVAAVAAFLIGYAVLVESSLRFRR